MAEVSDFQLPEEDEEGEDVEDLEALDSIPYWSNEFDNEDIYGSDSDSFSHHLSEFMPSDHSIHAQIVVDGEGIDERDLCFQIGDGEGPDSDSVADVNYFRREDQVNFVMDLFERRADRSRVLRNDNSGSNPFSETLIDSSFRVLEGNREINADYVELGLDLGLGLGFNKHGEEDEDGGFMIAEGEGEFFVGRRASVSESGESSTIHAVGPFRDGLRVVGIDSESDEEEEGIVGIDVHTGDDDGLDRVPDDLGSPLCWDCLRLEDQRDTIEDFEWEEVDERVDEREVLNMLIDADEDRSVSTEIQSEAEAGVGIEEAIINLEWEVLLAVNNLERNPELEHDSESYLADHEDYIYPAEYEMLFGQFAENESSLKGSPPAARSVVNNLPSILLTQEDVQNNNALCAVCKDDISTEEQAKQLPCSHHYHGDCIIPWLGIRNTCPVCRYELPTDDPDYERRRTQRAGHRVPGDSQVGFAIFSEQ